MTDEQNKLPSPDRVIHEPARLAILTVLSSCHAADFLFLHNVTGLSKGNLSVQITNLEEAGLVEVEKEIVEKKTRTSVRLSNHGKKGIADYWRTMDEIRAQMEQENKSRHFRARRSVPGFVPRPAK